MTSRRFIALTALRCCATNNHAPATDLLDAGGNLFLSYGHIALQAEGQPVWFRKIVALVEKEEAVKK